MELAALPVFLTESLPSLQTSQAQPEPNCSLPASANLATSSKAPLKSRTMADPSLPETWVLDGVRLRH
jgi:hypothetical protein